jgi:hypothetical protein
MFIMSNKIRIYDRNLTIEQVCKILPDVDDDMLYDIATAINQYDNAREILVAMDRYTNDKVSLNKLYELFGKSYEELIPSKTKKKKKEKKNKVSLDSDTSDYEINDKVDNFKMAESPKIEIGKNYDTNRTTRVLCPIDEIPDVDFDMPTVPEINK